MVKTLTVGTVRLSPSAQESYEEALTRWHLSSLFMTKVFDRCRETGVTPMTANGEVQLAKLLIEAEKELDLHISEATLDLMPQPLREKVDEILRNRRQFVYSVFLRMTSGAILK